MTQAQHTQGPWGIETGLIGDYQHYAIYHEDQELRSQIAIMYDSKLCAEHGKLEANARLIAAAPDLLHTLYGALPFVEDCLDSAIYKKGVVQKMINEIRAIISKVEGE